MQSAGGDVRAAAELAARVQLGEDHLDPGQPGLGLLVDRDAAAVVVHLGGAVRVQDDVDAAAEAAERLVHRVVDDLPHAVHQPAGVGGADVHARSLADRLEPLEDEQVVGVVRVVDRGSSGGAGWHVVSSGPGGPAGCAGGLLRGQSTRDTPTGRCATPTADRGCRTPPWGMVRTTGSRRDNKGLGIPGIGNPEVPSRVKLGDEPVAEGMWERSPISMGETDHRGEASGVIGCCAR